MTYKCFDTVLTFLYFLKYNYLLDSDAIMLFEMVRRLLFARISQATRIEIVNKKITYKNLYRETKCREISMLNCAFKSKFLRSFQKFNVISKKFCTMQNSTFIKNLKPFQHQNSDFKITKIN